MTSINEAMESFKDQAKLLVRSLSSPFLIWFMLVGNSIMLSVSTGFYFFEADYNPQVHGLMDAVWWGFTTVTTVGYGDIVPVTTIGRLLGILLMVTGTVFFVGFTAIFVSALVALHTDYLSAKEEEITMREYRNVMAAVKRIEQRISQLERK